MSPIVTLLTDFGLADSYVAEMKATILRLAPHAVLVDVSHNIEPGDVFAAQYLLSRTWHRFPRGTIHLAVVDPGVGTDRRALALTAQAHFFLGPDNGLLTPVLDGARVVQLPIPAEASATFHGRDVFAPAAARLARGDILEELGERANDPVRSPLPAPRQEAGRIVGKVIYVDRFGTLVTNVPGAALNAAASVAVTGGYAASVGRTFGDVAPGELVAFAGSGGTVEIAARDRSAAQLTGLSVGAEVRIERRET